MEKSLANKTEPGSVANSDTTALQQCQQQLGIEIKKALADQSVDSASFGKQILTSTCQLHSLQNGTVDGFYTYGLYLKALRRALDGLGLSEDSEIESQYRRLVEHHEKSPHGQQIMAVRQVVNKTLGKAPSQSPQAEGLLFKISPTLIFLIIAGLALGISIVLGWMPSVPSA